jgi:hypothetical protein
MNNTLWYSTIDMGTMHASSWTTIPGATDSAASLTGSQVTGDLTLVVKGIGSGIYVNTHFSSGWFGWTSLPGSTTQTPAATITDDSLHLVVIGADGYTIWYGAKDQNTGIFGDWNILSGYTPSKPTLAS